MTEAEAAAEVGKTVRTLRKWRQQRIGPPFAYFGRTVEVSPPDLPGTFQVKSGDARPWALPQSEFVRNEIGPITDVEVGDQALLSIAWGRATNMITLKDSQPPTLLHRLQAERLS